MGRRGPRAVLAPLARQSRGCRERSARGPGPGHRTLYRTRPSLELGQLPTSDTAPDTAPHRAGHYNGHYFPAPDTAPPPALDAFPLPLWGRRHRDPAGASKRPLAPQRLTLPPPCPLLSSPPPAASFPRSGRSPASFSDPLQLGPAARAPIPRLLARMPLPGGLWWLLCCRRGFTLLDRDYGDGELSGDGDEDEDEETFELRTPSPAGGGRVSPGGFGVLSQSLSPKPAVTSDPAPDSSQTACSWRTGDMGEVFAWGPGAPPPGAQGTVLLGMCLWVSSLMLGAVHLLGALRQGRRHAWPDLALPLPSPPGPRPIPSPSASASAEECGEAGWAARTPGSAPLPVCER